MDKLFHIYFKQREGSCDNIAELSVFRNWMKIEALQESSISFFNNTIDNINLILYLPMARRRYISVADLTCVDFWIPQVKYSLGLSLDNFDPFCSSTSRVFLDICVLKFDVVALQVLTLTITVLVAHWHFAVPQGDGVAVL